MTFCKCAANALIVVLGQTSVVLWVINGSSLIDKFECSESVESVHREQMPAIFLTCWRCEKRALR